MEADFSVAERELLRAYRAALISPDVRAVSRQQLLLQLRRNPSLAFLDGYWATPIDLSVVFQLPTVRNVLVSELRAGAPGEEAAALLAQPNQLKQLTAFAFTADALRTQARLLQPAEFLTTSTGQPGTAGIYIAPVRDVEWAVTEYLPPPFAPGTEDDCYFYCGDPELWDFDGDGEPDLRDEDDDNDGVPDSIDDYPFWPGAGDCECEAGTFVVFITKFASAITRAVLAAYSVVRGEASSEVTLGYAPGGAGVVRFTFPAAALAAQERPPVGDCTDPVDGAASYVSTNPEECARLRFRCEESEIPFSNDCGCGCKRP
jgi:hypothetical protein